MDFPTWCLLIGGLLLAVALVDTFVQRLPVTTTIIYLAVGIALGPAGLEVVNLHPVKNAAFFERVTELAVVISLFTAGLKLRAPLQKRRWAIPLRLASLSMTLTVALIAAAAVFVLGLPLGAGILLGAILAPTDPVLASDVQLPHPGQRDRLRFSLTGEAGLNDGTAFPFVMLGLGLLGLHEIGTLGWRWLAVDAVWAVVGGLAIGGALGTAVGKAVTCLRKRERETAGRSEFIALGLIGSAYGISLLLHAYGFLAVFAAGLALRHYELASSSDPDAELEEAPAPGEPHDSNIPTTAPAEVAAAVLGANEQLERIMEASLVLMIGAMISQRTWTSDAIWLAVLLFFVIRPIAIWVGTVGCKIEPFEKGLMGWFGIRGIGSLYYLMYAIGHGLPEALAQQLSALVLSLMIISIFVHGISVTPIMNIYDARKKRAGGG